MIMMIVMVVVVMNDYDGDGDLKTPANQTVKRNRFLLTRNRRMDMHI
jgi:hypothetical protein